MQKKNVCMNDKINIKKSQQTNKTTKKILYGHDSGFIPLTFDLSWKHDFTASLHIVELGIRVY